MFILNEVLFGLNNIFSWVHDVKKTKYKKKNRKRNAFLKIHDLDLTALSTDFPELSAPESMTETATIRGEDGGSAATPLSQCADIS